MIDIHSHLLFGVDDGPQSIEESIELLKQAIEVGYTGIVCSAHYYVGRFENEKYMQNFSALQKRIAEEGLAITIYSGNEFALVENFYEHIERINRINGGKYILVELKNELIYPLCKSFFEELLSKGIIPILAHVERYPHLKIQELVELYSMGVILQMNLNTAVNPSKKIEYLLKNRYIGVIATDSHRLGKRNYSIGNDLKVLEKILGEEYFNEVTQINPRKIIESRVIERIGKGESDEIKEINGIRCLFSSLWSKLWRG